MSKLENELISQNKQEVLNPPLNYNQKSGYDDILYFSMGFLLFGGGLYWIIYSFFESITWGRGFCELFELKLPIGAILIPFLFGVGFLYFFEKKTLGIITSCLGLLIILVSLITSIEFKPLENAFYAYIMMFGMFIAGSEILIRTLFLKKRVE